MRKWALGIFALAALLICSSCASEDRGTRDAPIDTNLQANQAPFILNGPDHFHGLALMCLDNDLTVTHTREAAPVIVPRASACDPGVAEAIGIPRVRGVTPTTGRPG